MGRMMLAKLQSATAITLGDRLTATLAWPSACLFLMFDYGETVMPSLPRLVLEAMPRLIRAGYVSE